MMPVVKISLASVKIPVSKFMYLFEPRKQFIFVNLVGVYKFHFEKSRDF